jgi:hypothetical protein
MSFGRFPRFVCLLGADRADLIRINDAARVRWIHVEMDDEETVLPHMLDGALLFEAIAGIREPHTITNLEF